MNYSRYEHTYYVLIYCLRPVQSTRSRLSSLLTEFRLGGEFPDDPTLLFLERLNLAISSPKTSPVRKADIKSSNSPFASFSLCVPLPQWPFFKCKVLDIEDKIPSRLCFRSRVSFRNSASCLARFSSSSCRRRRFSLSCLASKKAVRNVSKIPKNSSGWIELGSSPKRRTARSNRV